MRAATIGTIARQRASGGGVFSPLDLPGIARWYDAADAATVTSSGGLVSQWDDKSGASAHATQATDGSKYTYSAAAVNGLNAMTASGSGAMNFSSTGNGLGLWMFCVGGNSRASGSIFLTTSLTTSYMGHVGVSGTSSEFAFSPSKIAVVTAGAAASNGSINLFGVAFDGSNFNAFFNSTVGASSAGDIAVGFSSLSNYPAGSFKLNGTICEIFFGFGTLTSGQLADAKAYLKAKWGTP